MAIHLNGKSKLSQALKLHPDVLEYVISLNPHDFNRLRNPLMRRLMPPRISLDRIAAMVQKPVGELLLEIHKAAGINLSTEEQVELGGETGRTPDPSQSPEKRPEWTKDRSPLIVDLLPADERLDEDPMVPIYKALKANDPGTVILIKHKWEPQPLFDVWDKGGIEYYSERKGPDEWHIFIRKNKS